MTANVDLMAREDEFALLRVQKCEEVRSTEVFLGQLAKRHHLEEELLDLNVKVSITFLK